jgi:hypothetical protein
MRKTIAAGAIIAAATSTVACSQTRAENREPGPTTERSFAVGAFDRVELAGAYDAIVRTGSAPSVRARGGQNQLDELVVEVKDGELRIHPKEKRGFHWGWSKSQKLALTITVPQLRGATLAGAGGIDVDKVQGDRFDGQVAGSGDLRIGSVNVGALKLGIAGSGGVTAGVGKARNAEYEIAGSGGVDAQSIATESLKVSIAGSGDVKAHATRDADVDIMGSGSVQVTGGAKCSVSKAGSGNVRCS